MVEIPFPSRADAKSPSGTAYSCAFASARQPSSASTSSVSAPSSGAGPATRPGVRENQVGTPGKRTGPCGVSTVSNIPTALRCGSSNSAPGVFNGAAGISSSRNSVQPLLRRTLLHRLGHQPVDGVDLAGTLLQRRVQLAGPRWPHGVDERVPVLVVVDQHGNVAVAGAVRPAVGRHGARIHRGPSGGSNSAPLACSTRTNEAMVSNMATSTSWPSPVRSR